MLLAGLLVISLPLVAVKEVTRLGNETFNIGGFFNFFAETNAEKLILKRYGVLFYEAMRFAVKKINEDPSILYGFQIAATAPRWKSSYKEQIFDILNGIMRKDMPFSVGPLINQNAFAMSVFASSVTYPLVSYSATFDTINTPIDKTFFFRTVPADTFRVRAALQIIQSLKWNYVSVISSFDKNGERTAKLFVDNLNRANVCLGEHNILPPKPTYADYNQGVRSVSVNSRIEVLILFTYFKDTQGILSALRRNNLTRRFYIFAALGLASYQETLVGNEDLIEGSLSIEFSSFEVPGFRDYFQKLTPTSCKCSSWYQKIFNRFWEETFRCKLQQLKRFKRLEKSCTGKEKLQEGFGYYSNIPVNEVMDAVYALTYSLKDFVTNNCTNNSLPHNPCQIKRHFFPLNIHMRNILARTSFRDATLNLSAPFAKRDKAIVEYEIQNVIKTTLRSSDTVLYQTQKIGKWTYRRKHSSETGMDFFKSGNQGTLFINETNIHWGTTRKQKPQAVCSKPCKSGEYLVRDSHSSRYMCCWKCIECPNNHIVFNNTCVDCGVISYPNSLGSECLKLPELDLSTDNNVVKAFIVLTSIGLIATLLVAILFLRNNSHKTVKASGRDLCYFLIFGIFLTFLTPSFFLIRPSVTICALRSIWPGIAFCMCYAPLFLKTNRIYRIFHHAQTSVGRPPLVSPKAQVVIMLGIFTLQVLLSTVWLASITPEPLFKASKAHDFVTYQCPRNTFPIMSNLFLSIVLMVGCTWQAFKTRNFPKNFNEAKYIGFTLYITCICWASFLPAYFITQENTLFLREFLVCTICDLIGFVTLCGLFGQKIKQLLWPQQVVIHASDAASMNPSFLYITEKFKKKEFAKSASCENIGRGIGPSASTNSAASDFS